MSIRSAIFTRVGRLSPKLPPFRGRTRIFLELHRALGLRKRHIPVRVDLTRPVRFSVQLDLHCWLQRIAFLTGSYEADTVRFLDDLRKRDGRGGYFLDIGANIGLITIPMTLLTGVESVAIEAVPDNARALKTNVSLNELDHRIKVINTGLGQIEKTVEIQVEGDLARGEGSGTASVLPDSSKYPCVRQTIDIRRLDSLYDATEIPKGCSIIKIDTDGFDLKIIKGAQRLLEIERPIIYGEFAAHCLRWHGESITDVEQYAASVNYRLLPRLSPHWRFTENVDASNFVSDLLLIPQERYHLFAGLIGE